LVKKSSKRYIKLNYHAMKKSLSFISDLKNNNHTEWFHANRPRYDEARGEFLAFVDTLIGEIQAFDPSVSPADAKSAIFRINRDIRFSNDKSPYKTNFGAFIVPGGKKSGNAGYYFHLDPDGSFAGGGVYHPMPDILKKIRNEIYGNPEEFKGIIEGKEFYDYFGDMYDDRLKTPPKGFPKEFEHIDLLKYKSYIVSRGFDNHTLTGDRLVEETVKTFRLMYPLNKFINYALGAPD
jgi:uncharacterized protein (TIGR02453 family)